MTPTNCITPPKKPPKKNRDDQCAKSPLKPAARDGGADDANTRLIAGGTPVPRVNPLGVRILSEEEVEALFDNMPV